MEMQDNQSSLQIDISSVTRAEFVIGRTRKSLLTALSLPPQGLFSHDIRDISDRKYRACAQFHFFAYLPRTCDRKHNGTANVLGMDQVARPGTSSRDWSSSQITHFFRSASCVGRGKPSGLPAVTSRGRQPVRNKLFATSQLRSSPRSLREEGQHGTQPRHWKNASR